jgi:Ca-activated chloride channel family protein
VSFFAPALLVFLLVVPAAAAGYVWLDRRRDRRASAWAAPSLLPNMTDRPSAWRRHLPVVLLLAGAALLLVGFARPTAKITVKRQEATVVVVLDESGSMAARDSLPTRLAAAKSVALRYVDALPSGYRMSVITFSDHVAVSAPPTHDLTAVRAAITSAKAGPQGTALADAVVKAVNVGRTVKGTQQGTRPPAVVILLSDGGQTAGRYSPQQAAAWARQWKIPISSVALGTPDGVVLQPLKSGYTEQIQVPVQPAPLQVISRTSGGRFSQGAASVDVKSTYAALGSRVGKQHKTFEVTAIAAAGGIVFMLAGALLSGAWFRRFP